MNNIEELKALLTETDLLNFTKYDGREIDEMLDSRDSVDFETDWLKVFQDLEQTKFLSEELSAIKEIRQISYEKTYNSTQHSDLASYVADDFEMFAKSLISGYTNEWLNGLFLSYLHGLFPHSKIASKGNGLELILETASLQKIAA